MYATGKETNSLIMQGSSTLVPEISLQSEEQVVVFASTIFKRNAQCLEGLWALETAYTLFGYIVLIHVSVDYLRSPSRLSALRCSVSSTAAWLL